MVQRPSACPRSARRLCACSWLGWLSFLSIGLLLRYSARQLVATVSAGWHPLVENAEEGETLRKDRAVVDIVETSAEDSTATQPEESGGGQSLDINAMVGDRDAKASI